VKSGKNGVASVSLNASEHGSSPSQSWARSPAPRPDSASSAPSSRRSPANRQEVRNERLGRGQMAPPFFVSALFLAL
jgi:hypothetical protein